MTDNWKEVTADWCGDYAFNGTNQAGGSIVIGSGEGKPGVSPMEMLLLSVAGCTGSDVVAILAKKNITLKKFQIQVRCNRVEEHPKVYSDIDVVYHFWGDGLSPKNVEEAIKLSEEKFCSVGAMLRPVAIFSSSYQIHSEE